MLKINKLLSPEVGKRTNVCVEREVIAMQTGVGERVRAGKMSSVATFGRCRISTLRVWR